MATVKFEHPRAAQDAAGQVDVERAVIEQAKGALMLAYGIEADAAFAMLRWWSRNQNVKVRDLAGSLVAALVDGRIAQPSLRTALDDLLHDLAAAGPSAATPSPQRRSEVPAPRREPSVRDRP